MVIVVGVGIREMTSVNEPYIVSCDIGVSELVDASCVPPRYEHKITASGRI